MSEEPQPDWIDLAFGLAGPALPRDHHRALLDAVSALAPWVEQAEPVSARITGLSAAQGDLALVGGRTRLVLRLPRWRSAAAAAALQGRSLLLGGSTLKVGAPQTRELRPWNTLFAHRVASPDSDESRFMAAIDREMAALPVQGRAICGRLQASRVDGVHGFALMVDRLSVEHAMTLLIHGLGPQRRLGCGVFVPHKSAAAVGMPA